MNRICHFFLWGWMLSKRLYKKPSFLLLLLLIPVLVIGYGSVDKQNSGVLTVALACEDPADDMAENTVDTLIRGSRVIRFVEYPSAAQARDAVIHADADAAWIFKDHMKERVQAYAESPTARNAFIRVIEREQNTVLLLSREKLGGAAFTAAAGAFYRNYIRENVPALNDLSDQELDRYFEGVQSDTKLFEFESLYSSEETDPADFLSTPVRGLLAVVVVMTGLATAIYYIQDDRQGVFSWVPESRKPLTELGYQVVSFLNIGLAVMLSLWLSGSHGSLGREAMSFGVFLLTVVSFSAFMGMICRSISVLAALLPVLLMMMIAICPVFYDLGRLRTVQLLFPPTYFINGPFYDRYLVLGLGYSALLLVLWAGTRILQSRRACRRTGKAAFK